MDCRVSTQKTTPESGICILQMFVSILTAGWYRPDCRCNCNNNHYYFSGLLQVQVQVHRRLDIAITNMYAGPVQVFQTCMHVGTSLQSDMTAG